MPSWPSPQYDSEAPPAPSYYITRPVEWYQFNRKLLKYDVNEDKWTCLGDYEQGARAGAAMVSDGSSYYIINGELKPGIRTKDINRIKFN